jgi:hypothetical protein
MMTPGMAGVQGQQAETSALVEGFFFGSADLLFGLEPVVKLGAGLVAAVDVEFVRSMADSLFERKCLFLAFFCACGCWHEITSDDDGSTAVPQSETTWKLKIRPWIRVRPS